MSWVTELTGLAQETRAQVLEHLHLEGDTLVSSVNGKAFGVGDFTMPRLEGLRSVVRPVQSPTTVRQSVADVQDLHRDPSNAGALFQVASQFNMLEMVGPHVTPDEGVGIYEYDRTQGPACAIACGAGTLFRNYFVPVGDGLGQTDLRQLDGLADISAALGNGVNDFWRMQNGYVVPQGDGLERVSAMLALASEAEIDQLRGLLRVGMQQNVQVTLSGATHAVTQVYCSAMPVAYSDTPSAVWERIARLVLEGAYEATMLAACHNAQRTGNRAVFLTLLGGGAFGNPDAWIAEAALRALNVVKDYGLEVTFVSYGGDNPTVTGLIRRWDAQSRQ